MLHKEDKQIQQGLMCCCPKLQQGLKKNPKMQLEFIKKLLFVTLVKIKTRRTRSAEMFLFWNVDVGKDVLLFPRRHKANGTQIICSEKLYLRLFCVMFECCCCELRKSKAGKLDRRCKKKKNVLNKFGNES